MNSAPLLIPKVLEHAIIPSDQQQYHYHLVNGPPRIACLEFYYVRKSNLETPSAIYLFLPTTDHQSLCDTLLFTIRF